MCLLEEYSSTYLQFYFAQDKSSTELPCAAEYGDCDSSNALKFADYFA